MDLRAFYRCIRFGALAGALFLVACRGSHTRARVTTAAAVETPAAEPGNDTIVATPLSGTSIERTRALLDAFILAYDHHDPDGVLATLSDDFQYGDCDYGRHQFHNFRRDRAQLRSWLVDRFADNDYFSVFAEYVATPYGTPPNDPRVAGLDILRSSDTLQSLVNGPLSIGVKILLNAAGDRIMTVAAASFEPCATTLTPVASP